MTREEQAKKLLPIIQAIADGKELQFSFNGVTWIDETDKLELKTIIDDICADSCDYRIKPDYCEKLENDLESQGLENKDFVYDFNNQHTNYRPFKDCDELVKCWEKKMLIPAVKFTENTRNRLYRPSIWIKNKNDYTERLIVTFGENFVKVGSKTKPISLYVLFTDYEFLDGTPCGITE